MEKGRTLCGLFSLEFKIPQTTGLRYFSNNLIEQQ